MIDGDFFSFLLTCGSATFRFDAAKAHAERVASSLDDSFVSQGIVRRDARTLMWQAISQGVRMGDHLDSKKSEMFGRALIWLCLTCEARESHPDSHGFIASISMPPTAGTVGVFFPSRFTEFCDPGQPCEVIAVPSREDVEKATAEARKPRSGAPRHIQQLVGRAS